MFKGGDYVDNPKFYDENVNQKNTLDNSVSTLLSSIYRTSMVRRQNMGITQNTTRIMRK